MLEPAVKVLLLAGLVMDTVGGNDGRLTVTVTILDVVELLLASVALAVKL